MAATRLAAALASVRGAFRCLFKASPSVSRSSSAGDGLHAVASAPQNFGVLPAARLGAPKRKHLGASSDLTRSNCSAVFAPSAVVAIPEAAAERGDGADDGEAVFVRRHVVDEGAVDLDAVEGELPETAERRIAGAEIAMTPCFLNGHGHPVPHALRKLLGPPYPVSGDDCVENSLQMRSIGRRIGSRGALPSWPGGISKAAGTGSRVLDRACRAPLRGQHDEA